MEPPLPAISAPSGAATAAVVAPPSTAVPPPFHLAYADSVDSSPRSRDGWEEPMYPTMAGAPTSTKLRLMCSYGGHILPRPHDKSLCYAGGDTRIVVVHRHTSLSDLAHRLSRTLLNGRPFTLKYQLPNEDLDSLISVTTDEDLENMIEEYDRLSSNGSANKSSRIRLFLFPTKPDSASSIGSLLENPTKSEDWFLNALNGTTRGFSDSSSVNCLLGLEDDADADAAVILNNSNEKDVETPVEPFGNVKGASSNKQLAAQDVQSVPDSPMLETTSSFGSTSSSPSLANLPPIKVRVEDQKMGIEEQFSQMAVGVGVANNNVQPQQQQQQQPQRQEDGGFMALSSPPTALTSLVGATIVSSVPVGWTGGMEYQNRIISDDERSDHGVPVGYRKPPQAQPQQLPQPPSAPTQFQQKPIGGGADLPSPDSVSSDGSIANPLSRQKQVTYEDSILQMPSGNIRVSSVDPKINDPTSRIQIQQQLQDGGYVLPTQYDPQHASLLQLQRQQFVHPGAQYIQPGTVPMFYSVYPPQQQNHPHHPAHSQQYPMYYVPAGQGQCYNLPLQQTSYGEAAAVAPASRPQTPPSAGMGAPAAPYNPATNATSSKPEMSTGLYRTGTAQSPQLVQVPSSQHHPQYVGFSQIPHPSQSIAPSSAATANYGYEYPDQSHTQFYYTQPMPQQLAGQYRTMTSAGAVVLPETAAQLPADNFKQQIRTTQP